MTVSWAMRLRSSGAIDWKKSQLRPLEVAVRLDGLHVDGLVADLGLALGRADVDAHAAAGAVVGRDLDGEPVVGQVVRAELPCYMKPAGAPATACGREDLHADRGVRADDGALAAVDADVGIPDRDLLGDGPLLVLVRAGRERAVDRQRADRQQVALAGHERPR